MKLERENGQDICVVTGISLLMKTVAGFGTKIAKPTVLVIAIFMLVGLANAQSYQQYVDGQPSKTDVMAPKEFMMRTGATVGAVKTVPTGNNESGLPFTVDKNYPPFYFIPADKRPRIMNQGSCSSCTAWATTTALASILARQGKYSPQFNSFLNMPDAIQFYIMGGRLCNGQVNVGWDPADAMKRVTDTGTFLSVVEPISNQGVLGGSYAKPMGDWWVKAGKSGSLTNKDAMRKFIATQGALVADMDLPIDFNRYTSGIYNHQEFVTKIVQPLQEAQKTATNQALAASYGVVSSSLSDAFNIVVGGHAVTVIGYFVGGKIKLRDYLRPVVPPNTNMAIYPDIEIEMPAFWIVQNSWGDTWGMNGLFYVAANQTLNGRWFDKTSNRWFSTSNVIDDAMYYMLDPTITSKGKDIRELPATPAARTITFKNEAGYVAKLSVVYFVNQNINGTQVPMAKALDTSAIPVGVSKTLEIPRDTAKGMPISVAIEGIGTTKGKVLETTVPEGFNGNLCFKSWGTIFDAKGGACQ
ncbi:MAG: hypothetical protein JST85_21050 [Acidobacteria bacterium]|nr:hypothetical protein [Acidobacteriota bacterium]